MFLDKTTLLYLISKNQKLLETEALLVRDEETEAMWECG